MSELMLREALEELAATAAPVDFVPRVRSGVRRRRHRQVTFATLSVLLVLGGTAAGVVAATRGGSSSTDHRLDSDTPPGAPPLQSHGKATRSAPIVGYDFGPPEAPDMAMDPHEAYAIAWAREPVTDATSAFALLAHMTGPNDIDEDAWLLVYQDHCHWPRGGGLSQPGESPRPAPTCTPQPYTVAIDAQTGKDLGAFTDGQDPRDVLEASDDEQGGVQAVLDRRRFQQWMSEHYPDVPLTDRIFNSPYNREWGATILPGALIQTQEGWIEGASGRWVAPEGSVLIGNGFHPQARQVAACRNQPDSGDCGLWLAMADGNFHPDGGYPHGDGVFYTQKQIARAVAAAGYTYHVSAPPRCHGDWRVRLWSDRDGQDTPVDAAVWFAKYVSPQRITTQGWRQVDVTASTAVVASGTTTLHAVRGPDGTWQVDGGSCGG